MVREEEDDEEMDFDGFLILCGVEAQLLLEDEEDRRGLFQLVFQVVNRACSFRGLLKGHCDSYSTFVTL